MIVGILPSMKITFPAFEAGTGSLMKQSKYGIAFKQTNEKWKFESILNQRKFEKD